MAKLTNKLTSTKEVAGPSPSSDRMDEWRVKEALETIQRAEEHQSNKGLMREVKKLAKQRMKTLGKIC